MLFCAYICGDEGYRDMGIWGYGQLRIWGYEDIGHMGILECELKIFQRIDMCELL